MSVIPDVDSFSLARSFVKWIIFLELQYIAKIYEEENMTKTFHKSICGDSSVDL